MNCFEGYREIQQISSLLVVHQHIVCAASMDVDFDFDLPWEAMQRPTDLKQGKREQRIDSDVAHSETLQDEAEVLTIDPRLLENSPNTAVVPGLCCEVCFTLLATVNVYIA